MNFEDIITECLESFGVTLTPEQVAEFNDAIDTHMICSNDIESHRHSSSESTKMADMEAQLAREQEEGEKRLARAKEEADYEYRRLQNRARAQVDALQEELRSCK